MSQGAAEKTFKFMAGIYKSLKDQRSIRAAFDR